MHYTCTIIFKTSKNKKKIVSCCVMYVDNWNLFFRLYEYLMSNCLISIVNQLTGWGDSIYTTLQHVHDRFEFIIVV